MPISNREFENFFEGLKTLEASLYPKRCNACGRLFSTPQEFLLETRSITRNVNFSGLKVSYDDDGRTVIEAFRNCPCGSTLLSNFGDRRDLSEAGVQRREQFDELLTFLMSQGMERDLARGKLLTVLKMSNGSVSFSAKNSYEENMPGNNHSDINNISMYLTAF